MEGGGEFVVWIRLEGLNCACGQNTPRLALME